MGEEQPEEHARGAKKREKKREEKPPQGFEKEPRAQENPGGVKEFQPSAVDDQQGVEHAIGDGDAKQQIHEPGKPRHQAAGGAQYDLHEPQAAAQKHRQEKRTCLEGNRLLHQPKSRARKPPLSCRSSS